VTSISMAKRNETLFTNNHWSDEQDKLCQKVILIPCLYIDLFSKSSQIFHYFNVELLVFSVIDF
jgi:hypothetical protein